MLQKSAKRWPQWIESQLIRRGIEDDRVLRAFEAVPREAFIPSRYRDRAYSDRPVNIGCRQTISQPFVVALSIQALELTGTEKVLDVGTGSGYQAVLLSHLAREVFSIEVHHKLFINAKLVVERCQRAPVYQRHGDGSLGWAAEAPFDAIVAGARAPHLPQSLADQLAVGGRMVIPIGGESAQGLFQFKKEADGILRKKMLTRVVFVPLVGREGTGGVPD